MTKKLFLQDSYVIEFEAKVIEKGMKEELNYVVLDKTAFYPEGGGQPWDLGVLNNSKVTKVLEEDGAIYHYVDTPIESETVVGKVDWARRFDHMQQHLGQHILSGVFERLLDGETVGFHLGEEYVTVDIALENITKEQLAEIENEANRVVYDNLAVKAYYVDNKEVKKLPMRKPPKVDEDIRIIEVDNYDFSGCGGTHPKTTGEVGIIKIIRTEKVRGNVRVEFLCGKRALLDYRQKNNIILESSSILSRPFYELKEGLSVIKDQLSKFAKENKILKQNVSVFTANDMYKNAQQIGELKVISKLFEGEDFGDITGLASKIIENQKAIVLFANKGEKAQLVFTCSKDVDYDMNTLLKDVLPLINGTGGGNKFRAQGGASTTHNIESVLDAALIKIKNKG